jgi:hypothetical protein
MRIVGDSPAGGRCFPDARSAFSLAEILPATKHFPVIRSQTLSADAAPLDRNAVVSRERLQVRSGILNRPRACHRRKIPDMARAHPAQKISVPTDS